MRKRARHLAIVLTLLVVPSLLWVGALLFRFRVSPFFHGVLMKTFGPVVIWGAMSVCPLLALILGIRLMRKERKVLLGGLVAASSSLLLVAFVVWIAVPTILKALEPATPKNPSRPRPVPPQAGFPVFPGAEGFGTRTPAGRGGHVIEVTSLADDGPGTLRAALQDPSPRIIVFRVGGTIELESELSISHPFVTVAGQTAPGDGVCIKNAGIAITTHDVLVQHLRVRPGNEGPVDADVNDAVSLLGRHGEIDGAHHVVLDHVSASWAEDETVSTWYGAHDVTISWSIISEALNRSRHRKRTHSAGLLVGDGSYHVSVHHNLLAHNDFRNPLISEGGTHDVVNNVVYDWGVLPAEITDADSNSFLNFVGNHFIPGPSTQPGPYEILVNPEYGSGRPLIYVEGNLGPHRPDLQADEWALVGYGFGREGVAPETYRSQTRFAAPSITEQSAADAFEQVLAEAGATAPRRDAVDRRVILDVRNKTGSIIDSPEQVGGYPKLDAAAPPADSDHDGMPDSWEAERGLDPGDPADGNQDADGDGYSNIEEYLHQLASDDQS
jgi:pectate lyase